MAALVLSIAGAALGNAFLGPLGAVAGRLVGALAGNVIDQALFGNNRPIEGPRLSDLDVMASSEGAPIPRVYGRARLAGQVIWATRLEEVASSRSASGGKGGLIGGRTQITYSYFANFAVGLCEGEIGQVARIWADGKPLDLTGVDYRVHAGGETQMPDGLIMAKEGDERAPAYRGLAYIVFERLPLEDFGNRIPQLSFEIVRPIGRLEKITRAVTLIPGAAEFAYEPSTVLRLMGPGQTAVENRHVADADSDVIASLDALQAACPNLERVAIVVTWFGSDLRAGHCTIRPGVDSAVKATHGATWSVAGLARASAYVVSTVDDRPAFGGTPSDESVRHLIAELKARGLKVTLYPFVMMDIPADNALPDPRTGAAPQPAYPWRGRVTCDPAPGQPGSPDGTAAAATQVASFFHGGGPTDWSYRRMILHYAALADAAGGVDAFLIGSELIGLTRVRAASGVYPAVGELATLAGDVKAILGSGTVVTYGADWTEYGAHVVDAAAEEVRFPLDALWASPNIDAVGIDYYAPLSDWRDNAGHLDAVLATSIYEASYLAANLRGGEAFDWYYPDAAARAAQARSPITDGLGKPWIFRAKDVWSWWSNPHYERVAGAELPTPTAWVARGKPIWLTETGCPAIEKGTNQPSIFPDAKSAEAGTPHFSNGRRDDFIQRRHLETVLDGFDPEGADAATMNPVSPVYGGRMVDISAIHLWTWDARPYPVFPAALDSWSDGANWETGHWLTGRLGGAPLGALVETVLGDCGITGIDASALGDGPEGYVVDRPMAPRAMIEPLTSTYACDAAALGSTIVFRPRGSAPVAELGESDLVIPERGASARLTRAQETELPREVSLGYSDANADFRRAAVKSRRLVGGSARAVHTDLAIVTHEGAALRRAEIMLRDIWAGRETAEFAVGARHVSMVPGDVVGLTVAGRRRLFEIREVVDAEGRQIKARGIDPEALELPSLPSRPALSSIPPAIGPAHVLALDLPNLDETEPATLTRLAVFADPWPGVVTIWRSSDGTTFEPFASATAPSIIGETLDDLSPGPASRWNRFHEFRVRLFGGTLAAIGDRQVLDGGNAAALRRPDGAWEVMQFGGAELVDTDTYRLTRLLRGQAGSEWAMGDPLPAGAPFVLLDRHVVAIASGSEAIDRAMELRIVASGRSHDDASATAMTVTPTRTALLPLSPVHARARRRSDGVHLSWVRRTRKSGDGWSGEVPLAEERESYIVEILGASGVARTIQSETTSTVYASADELADFGSAQSTLTVRVTQVSNVAGPGIALEAILHP